MTNPATGEAVGTVPNGSEEDVRAAIDAAAGALEGWKSLAAIERARILRRAADVIRERKEDIAAVMTAEQGKPLAEATGEVDYAAGFLEWFGGEAERVYGQVVPAVNPANRVLVLRQPVGVVAAITPWNFPAAMMTRKLGPAMAAGCTSVVEARERDAADGCAHPACDRGRRSAARGRQPGHLPLVRDGRGDDLLRPPRPQDLVHRLDRGRKGADPALRGAGEAALARTGWARPLPDLRRRRPRRRRRGPDRVEVPQRRPDLRLREPDVRAERRLRRVRRAGRREGRRG